MDLATDVDHAALRHSTGSSSALELAPKHVEP